MDEGAGRRRIGRDGRGPSDSGDDRTTIIAPAAGADPSARVDPHSAAGQYRGVDPGLVAATVGAQPTYRVPSRRRGFAALWHNWLRVRLPLIAVGLLLLGMALPRTVSSVVVVITAQPVPGTVALIAWLLYALPLLYLITRVDFFKRESVELAAVGMLWGGVVATSMAASANQAALGLLATWYGEGFSVRWGPVIVSPLVEEILKALGIVLAMLVAQRAIHSPLDGFVVGALVGLGFQVVENFVYTGNLLLSSSSENSIRTVSSVLLIRGLGSGLWSHAVYSGIVGTGIAYLLADSERRTKSRVWAAVALFALGWLMHVIWNIPVAGQWWERLAVIGKAVVILGMLALVIVRSQDRQSHTYTRYLEALNDPALVTPSEIEDLRTYRTREAAARRAAVTGGGRAADAVRRLQRRQAELAVVMAAGDLRGVAEAKRRVIAARAQVSATALLPPEVGHRWGVAAIWMSVLGVLLPVLGPAVAMVLAAIGTRQAQRSGAALATTVRAAWVLAAVSMLVGVVLVALLRSTVG